MKKILNRLFIGVVLFCMLFTSGCAGCGLGCLGCSALALGGRATKKLIQLIILMLVIAVALFVADKTLLKSIRKVKKSNRIAKIKEDKEAEEVAKDKDSLKWK